MRRKKFFCKLNKSDKGKVQSWQKMASTIATAVAAEGIKRREKARRFEANGAETWAALSAPRSNVAEVRPLSAWLMREPSFVGGERRLAWLSRTPPPHHYKRHHFSTSSKPLGGLWRLAKVECLGYPTCETPVGATYLAEPPNFSAFLGESISGSFWRWKPAYSDRGWKLQSLSCNCRLQGMGEVFDE